MAQANRPQRQHPESRGCQVAGHAAMTVRLESLERRIDVGYIAMSSVTALGGTAEFTMAAYYYGWAHNGPMTMGGIAFGTALYGATSWFWKKANCRRTERNQ